MVERLYGLLAWLLVLVLSAGILLWTYRRTTDTQPVAYNHKKHLEMGLECSTCHTGIAEGRARAGFPPLDVCASCHGAEDENPKAKSVRDHVAQNKPIPWKKIYSVPSHVYFSHRRHVASAKLDCAVCHGDMHKQEKPVTRQAVKIGMERCMGCHHESEVSNDCLSCHR